MKKYIYVFSLLMLFIFSCDKKIDVDTVNTFTEPYRFNAIGIVGKPSDTAYIEVWYSKKDVNNKNKLVHKWVKPPVIIGGHFTNVTFDSIHSNWAIFNKRRKARINYSRGGSHYMKIKNHSNEPIEYFISGTQTFRTTAVSGKNNIVDITPSVLYKNIPTYYMLFPEKAPKENIYTCVDSFCNEVKEVSFSTSKAYSIEQVMKLYRSAYGISPSDTLHYRYRKNWEKLSKKYPNPQNKAYREAKFYGKIMPKQSLLSSNKTPFIHHICGDSYCDAPINTDKDNP